jgi:hypothetical protein
LSVFGTFCAAKSVGVCSTIRDFGRDECRNTDELQVGFNEAFVVVEVWVAGRRSPTAVRFCGVDVDIDINLYHGSVVQGAHLRTRSVPGTKLRRTREHTSLVALALVAPVAADTCSEPANRNLLTVPKIAPVNLHFVACHAALAKFYRLAPFAHKQTWITALNLCARACVRVHDVQMYRQPDRHISSGQGLSGTDDV